MRTCMPGNKWSNCTLTVLCTCAILLHPVAGSALTVCSTPLATLCDTGRADYATSDCDNDGMTDKQECEGFNIPNSLGAPRHLCGLPGYDKTVDASGNSTCTTTTTTDRLDPSKPDLFYMATDMYGNEVAAGSLMYQALASAAGGNNVLKFYSYGLNVTAHQIKSTELIPGTDRGVTATVKAAWIRENTSTTAEGTYLGSTPEGKPTDLNIASTIYTQKIKNNVDLNCPTAKATKCSVAGANPPVSNLNGTDNSQIVNYYILQVASHEMGHGSRLATDPASYYHYSKSGTVMDPSASFSRGVYTIPTGFYPLKDAAALTLK